MEERITNILAATLGVPREEAGPGTTMMNTPKWTSLMHLNVCLSLETEFGVEFSPEDMAEAVSFEALVSVLSRLGAR